MDTCSGGVLVQCFGERWMDRSHPSFFSGKVMMETEGSSGMLPRPPPVCRLALCRGPDPRVFAALLDAPFDFAALFLVVFFVSFVVAVAATFPCQRGPSLCSARVFSPLRFVDTLGVVLVHTGEFVVRMSGCVQMMASTCFASLRCLGPRCLLCLSLTTRISYSRIGLERQRSNP